MKEMWEFYRGLQTHHQAVQELYNTTRPRNQNAINARLLAERRVKTYLKKNPSEAYNAGVNLAHTLNKLRFNPIKQSINEHIYNRQQAITQVTKQQPTPTTLEKLITQLHIHDTLPKNPLNT